MHTHTHPHTEREKEREREREREGEREREREERESPSYLAAIVDLSYSIQCREELVVKLVVRQRCRLSIGELVSLLKHL
jgi:hypothetical protein